MSTVAPARTATVADTRARIVNASYELFARRSIRDVAMDEVIAASGVAKATVYRHFPTKDDLVLAFLQHREEVWTIGTLQAGVRERAADAEGRLLAIFDVFDEWFHREDFEACTFVNVLLEMGADHPLGRASTSHLAHIRQMVSDFAVEAGLRDPEEFALSWHILMKGSIVEASEGHRGAALRAKRMGVALIESHRL